MAMSKSESRECGGQMACEALLRRDWHGVAGMLAGTPLWLAQQAAGTRRNLHAEGADRYCADERRGAGQEDG